MCEKLADKNVVGSAFLLQSMLEIKHPTRLVSGALKLNRLVDLLWDF
jgi:hypothetical protein